MTYCSANWLEEFSRKMGKAKVIGIGLLSMSEDTRKVEISSAPYDVERVEGCPVSQKRIGNLILSKKLKSSEC